MREQPLDVAGRPLREGILRRAWHDARPYELWSAIAGGIVTLLLTFAFSEGQMFKEPISLGDEILRALVGILGAVVTGLGVFGYHLIRAPFRQRTEARCQLASYMADDVSAAMTKLDSVHMANRLTAADALLLLKRELTLGLGRSQLVKQLARRLGMGEAELGGRGIVDAFVDANAIEINESARTRPYRMTEFGHGLCRRMEALGRKAPRALDVEPPVDPATEVVRVKHRLYALVEEGQALGNQAQRQKQESVYKRICETIREELITPTVEDFDLATERRIPRGMADQRHRELRQFAEALSYAAEITGQLKPEHLRSSLDE